MSEVNNHAVIFLSPTDFDEREWCEDDVWENSVRYNLGTDFDAQRLRADTAEANFNRCNGLYYECQKERDTLRSDLAAAEQRIADQNELIKKAHAWIDHNNFGGWDAYEMRDQLAAALNPNPEAESHE